MATMVKLYSDKLTDWSMTPEGDVILSGKTSEERDTGMEFRFTFRRDTWGEIHDRWSREHRSGVR